MVIVALAAACVFAWYAAIIVRRNKVQEALSSVDVHLNQRHDLIPNVVKLAGRFMEHERDLLTEVAKLREEARALAESSGEVGARFEVEGQLGQRVGQLFARMEAYPELKSEGPLIEAQRAWQEAEAQITAARRFYNAAVNQLRNATQIFPGPILASLAGVHPMPFFEAPAEARARPDVDELLGSGRDR